MSEIEGIVKGGVIITLKPVLVQRNSIHALDF